jgi:hypothetical protein
MPMVEGLRPVRRDGFPDVFGGTAPGERGRRLGFGCPWWQPSFTVAYQTRSAASVRVSLMRETRR